MEFGPGAEAALIAAFCDSPFVCPAGWPGLLAELAELFYHFKSETRDLVPDGELIAFMESAFNGPCQGSLELLAGRELPALARRLTAGPRLPQTEEEAQDE